MLELMLVVFIVSLLGILATPTYKSYIVKAQRIEAKSALYSLANSLESHRLQTGTYNGAKLSDLISKKYIFKLISVSKSEYTIQASIANIKHDLECQVFTLTSSGIRKAFGSAPGNCW